MWAVCPLLILRSVHSVATRDRNFLFRTGRVLQAADPLPIRAWGSRSLSVRLRPGQVSPKRRCQRPGARAPTPAREPGQAPRRSTASGSGSARGSSGAPSRRQPALEPERRPACRIDPSGRLARGRPGSPKGNPRGTALRYGPVPPRQSGSFPPPWRGRCDR